MSFILSEDDLLLISLSLAAVASIKKKKRRLDRVQREREWVLRSGPSSQSNDPQLEDNICHDSVDRPNPKVNKCHESVDKPKVKKRKRSNSNSHSYYSPLDDEVRIDPTNKAFYLGMGETSYRQLLALVTPLIQKQNTCMRPSISAHQRLSATLRYLATGSSYEELKFSLSISAQALGRIIPETCKAIWMTLQKDYFKFPSNEAEWEGIAKDYEEMWNFPNCLGAVAGKHVMIAPPNGAGSYYYNHKGHHSLVLVTIINARNEFILCDIGIKGSISDGEALQHTAFYEKLCNNNLSLPSDKIPNDSTTSLPYVFIGDEAFPLRTNFMTPYHQIELTQERNVFNYHLYRTYSVVEDVFAMIASRFKIFHLPINMKLENIESVVMASCALHNYLCNTERDSYTQLGMDHSDSSAGDPRSLSQKIFENLDKEHYQQCGEEAKQVQENFVKYFTQHETNPLKEDVY